QRPQVHLAAGIPQVGAAERLVDLADRLVELPGQAPQLGAKARLLAADLADVAARQEDRRRARIGPSELEDRHPRSVVEPGPQVRFSDLLGRNAADRLQGAW